MTSAQWIAQGMAFCGCVCACLSYLSKKRTSFLWLQIATNLAFAAQYFFLGAYDALINNGVTIVRTGVFQIYAYRKKASPVWIVPVFCALAVVCCLPGWQGFLTLVPIGTACIFTYATWQKNQIVEKILFIVCSLMWVAYNLYCGAYVSTVYCVAEIFASAFALARLCKKAGCKSQE